MATRSRTTPWRGGAWSVSAIGTALVFAALAYGGRRLGTDTSMYPVVETGVLLGLGGTVLCTGRWLRRSDLADRDLWRIAVWVSLGIILLVALTVWQLLTQVQGGATLRNPLLTLVVTQSVGATAGLLVGIYHVRSLRNARAAENATAAAEEALATQDQLEFVHMLVRHHMRNGMQVIQSYTNRLEPHVDGEGASHLATIQRRSERLVKIVEELQPVTDALEPDGRLRPTDLATVVEREAEHAALIHSESSIVATTPQTEPYVRADSLLPAAFETLFRHAVDHSGDRDPTVEATVECDADVCRVTILASGPAVDGGIDRAFQTSVADDEDAGLHIARKVLDRYGGTLSVGRENGGPRYTVELPLADCA
ncbi:MAG: HAMP domain-containing sensor histidine kinase [Halapricum sp.]